MFNSKLERPIIKVCGIQFDSRNEPVVQLEQIDWIGFIFFEGSARFTTQTLPTSNKGRVGVFVNASIEEVKNCIEKHHLTHVQLHGNESVEMCESLKPFAKVMKAFGIKDAVDLKNLSPYEGAVDYFLLDTKTPLHGGSGQQFDWNVLDAYASETPFLLSGGIGPDDVQRLFAFQHEKCIGIDLNSRFELEHGIKNLSVLTDFLTDLTTVTHNI